MSKIRKTSKSTKKEETLRTRSIFRSSKTGRFVTKLFADKHPKTTEKEKIQTIYRSQKDKPGTDDTGPRRK